MALLVGYAISPFVESIARVDDMMWYGSDQKEQASSPSSQLSNGSRATISLSTKIVPRTMINPHDDPQLRAMLGHDEHGRVTFTTHDNTAGGGKGKAKQLLPSPVAHLRQQQTLASL
jgi:hypothetical protein